MTSLLLGPILGITISFTTLYLIALGHGLFERAGMLDLAIDGVFFMSTGASVLGAYSTGSPVLGSLLASAVAGITGIALAFLMTALPVSHGALGLSMMFVGYGIGIILGYSVRISVGSILTFSYQLDSAQYILLLFTALLIGVLVHLLLEKTKLGAMIKACGENPHAAMALGVDVLKVRLIVAGIGFALVGFGSSLFTLAWQRYWDIKSYTLGFGWLAFTIALAGGRHPLVLMPLSLLFGGLYDNYMRLSALLDLPVDISKSIPFIAALLAMLLYSKTKLGKILIPPAGLGKIFHREERAV
ncbi:MAG: ribose ABC transporter permease [Desulfurococcaceae archaeon]